MVSLEECRQSHIRPLLVFLVNAQTWCDVLNRKNSRLTFLVNMVDWYQFSPKFDIILKYYLMISSLILFLYCFTILLFVWHHFSLRENSWKIFLKPSNFKNIKITLNQKMYVKKLKNIEKYIQNYHLVLVCSVESNF